MAKVIGIRADEWVVNILDALKREQGYNNTDAIREGLRLLYSKRLPAYVQVKKDKEVDLNLKKTNPEKYCTTVLGGEFRIENGRPMCVTKVKGSLVERQTYLDYN